MNFIKSRWNAMLVIVGLAGLLGCQGLSSNSQSQGTSQLAPSPASISFGSVLLGDSIPEAEVLKNTGGSNLTVTAATVSGKGFSYSGLSFPLVLTPNQTSTFSVNFAPTAAGTSSGNLSLTISGSTSSVDIALSGTGETPATATLSVTNPISVGSVVDGLSGTQTGTLTATGGDVQVSSVSMGGTNPTEFSISGLSFPVTVTTSQPVSFTVTFAPAATGAASATASFASNASGSPTVATLTGAGSAAPVHTVQLSWAASGSEGVTSYNVYRAVYGSNSCGAYTDIGSTPGSTTTYTDSVVADGTTYCYATTAVDANGESPYSNIVQAVIPAP